MVIKCDLISFDINTNILNVKKKKINKMYKRNGNTDGFQERESHIISSDLVTMSTIAISEVLSAARRRESLQSICKKGL